MRTTKTDQLAFAYSAEGYYYMDMLGTKMKPPMNVDEMMVLYCDEEQRTSGNSS